MYNGNLEEVSVHNLPDMLVEKVHNFYNENYADFISREMKRVGTRTHTYTET